jgi:predicted outer membrane repeat protein
MTAISLCTIVLALLGSNPGQTAGWETGEVSFVGRLNNTEHQEIYPISAGMYTVEVSILQVLNDPYGVLEYRASVVVDYPRAMGFMAGSVVDVTGIYYDGASPIAYADHIVATDIHRDYSWVEPVPEEIPDTITWSYPVTGTAEPTETTVTLHGTLLNDGRDTCRCRFVYQQYGGPAWTTEWVEDMRTGGTLTEKVYGLIPGKLYVFHMESENSYGRDTGREISFWTLAEKVPPIPYPAIWSTEPNQVDGTTITMTAGIERDITGPIEYWFDFVESPTGGAGGTDSTWLFTPTYVDVGLNPNHQYGYRVKGRDGNHNETAYSPVRYAYTGIETPSGVTFGDLTTSSIKAKVSGTLSGLTRGSSGVKLENTTAGQVSGWSQDNGFWLSDALLPNTAYTFRAQARNGDGDRTPFSAESRIYTLAMAPAAATVSTGFAGQLAVRWNPNGNPTGTQYWCERVGSTANSGWITSTQWLDTGLSANTLYSYRIKARNGDGVETAYSATAQAYSIIESPAGVTFGTITPSTIQVKSQSTPSGLDRGSSGLQFENATTGQISNWQHDNSTFWVSDNLQPNQSYTLRVRARNGDGIPTPWSQTTSIYSYANVPGSGAFTGVTLTSLQVQWSANGNPAGTQYVCENVTGGMTSGAITDTAWDNINLKPNTAYTYRVKARNADGVETAWVSLGTQSTDYRALTISTVAGGQVTAPGVGTFRYAPGASVPLAAAPSTGYHFLCWTGTAVDAGRVANAGLATTTVLVDSHYTLVANFLRTKIYVDGRSAVGGDGSTWAKAYTYLQDALSVAQPGNEICLAQGTYRPDKGKMVVAGDNTVSFDLRNGVRIKGGFAGLGASDPDARDVVAYATILSGDLKGNDSAVQQTFDLYFSEDASRKDNSIHVVTAQDVDSATLLDGVTITGGNGLEGAGIFMFAASPVVSQCTIQYNRSGWLSGDGLQGWGIGAGVSCYASQPSFLTCTFKGNWAGGVGSAFCTIESQPTLIGCAFRLNDAGMQGGAIYSEDSNSVLVNCVFQGNEAWDGGAIYASEGSDSRMTNCSFFGNSAFGHGGAVLVKGRDIRFINSVFSANRAMVEGGAVDVLNGSAVLTNCTLNRNLADATKGGQALAVNQAMAVLTNCIVWDLANVSTRARIALTGTTSQQANLIASYCDVQGGSDLILRTGNVTLSWGVGNIDVDPLFVSPAGTDNVAGTEDDNLRLQGSSPCIDAGNDTAVPTDVDDLNANSNKTERIPLDLASQGRFADRTAVTDTGVADPPTYKAVVDLGAYELPAQ